MISRKLISRAHAAHIDLLLVFCFCYQILNKIYHRELEDFQEDVDEAMETMRKDAKQKVSKLCRI